MRIENLWFGQGWRPFVGRMLLLPVTALYSLAWSVYLVLYRYHLKRATVAHPRVICVGNLTAGGSGKTPVTVFIADCLVQLGFSPVISCSGYGSPQSEGATISPFLPLKPQEWGDEPCEIRDFRPSVPIVVGRNRVAAASIAHREFPGSVLLMDDGFQHLPLHKHITIVLDPLKPLNSLPFPAGPYREPRWNRSRADLVLPDERFSVVYSPLQFFDPTGDQRPAPESAKVLTAIARPDLFLASLAGVGVEVSQLVTRPDHDPLDSTDLFSSHNEGVIVVTMKDWVKLRSRADIAGIEILVARRTATIEPAEEFMTWLKERIPE